MKRFSARFGAFAASSVLVSACLLPVQPAGHETPPPTAAPAAGLLSVEDVASRPAPGTSAPGALRFSPDDALITYLSAPEEGGPPQLLAFDPVTAQSRPVLAPQGGGSEAGAAGEDAQRGERQRAQGQAVGRYAWAEHGSRLLLPIRGGLFVQDGFGAALRAVVKPGGRPLLDPQLAPGGEQIAYVQDDELVVVPVAGGEPHAVSQGAHAHGVQHAQAEFMAEEEMGRQRGYWWSQNGRFLAYTEVNESAIPGYRIMHQGEAEVGEQAQEDQRYPFAGAQNAKVKLGVVPSAGGKTVWMDLRGAEYLARVDWLPDGRLAAQLENREQTRLDLVFFDARTGKGTPVLSEQTSHWINLNNLFRPLAAGGFLWGSERSGFQHLYLYDGAGQLVRPLTSGEWMVTALVDVDPAARKVYFLGTRDDARERHLYEVSLDGGEPRRITQQSGTHTVTLDHGFKRFIDVYSALDQPPRITLRALADGSELAVLHERPDPRIASLGLRPPRLVSIPARDGTVLYGALYEPDGPGPHRTLIDVYGGPTIQRVTNSWGMTADLRPQALRQRGFVVLKLDNRGSANRGVSFESAIQHDLGDLEVQDQVDGVHWLVAQGLTDAQHVGIYGWSYGGYMSAISLVRAPETFKLAVAGAPVTHWDGYDTHYTERYMGTPQSNPQGYETSAVMHYVNQLRGKLMLIHGLIDNNVHFRHSARLINALIGAHKDYELVVLPDSRHGPRSYADRLYVEQRIFGFIDANL